MSKRALKEVNYSIHQFSAKNKANMSFATRQSMTERLKTSFGDLHQIGYNIRHIRNLKANHVNELVAHWKEEGVSTGTIKNRMSDLRKVCEHYNRNHVIDKSNSQYGIEKRSYVPTENKAIHAINIDKIKDKNLNCSIQLQKEFGLRREECLKIKPKEALQQNESGQYYLRLQGSWTKGGIERTIPISNERQLEIIQKSQEIAGNGSMIPKNKNYIQQRKIYDRVTRENNLYNLHGLRHAYAQNRYKEIVNIASKGNGWDCPIAGGPKRNELTASQKKIDRDARLIISNELGHSRVAIIKNYIG
ncbi:MULTISPECIES: phage integrase N-terminal domain-containing protein [Cysteiniphilum]|uniref:Integrase n=1 Tax=Cysteiniphilum litorale TaxID=2056700 RepID=A0A8J2Z382_9GAMM|nr:MULTISPECIES: phage integrase N-terminal domain-containing protein [Cysteiniphilum]GGF92831.1 integrase [Cysteiniphilum litorale]